MTIVDLGYVNWHLLHEQKRSLLELIEVAQSAGADEHAEHLTGILHLIDHIQDEAVESGLSEKEVFALEEEDEEDGENSFLLAGP